MMRKYITSLLCTLMCSAAVHADGKEKTMYAAAPAAHSRWQQTSAGMASQEYQHSVNLNRDIVQQQLEIYSDRLLARSGYYGQAIGLLGAAAVLAATDRRYNLNDSKTVGMVFRDTASSDRTVLLEYRKVW